jgi:helicase
VTGEDPGPEFVPAGQLPRPAPPVQRTPARERSELATDEDPASRVSWDRVPVDPRLVGLFRGQGIGSLYPPQARALEPVLQGRSVLLACPTASGKSLVAYVGLLQAALEGRAGLYIVPLRALASEKYEELKAFQTLGLRVSLSMGDRDLSGRQLDRTDILVATSEKADSLLRHRSPWIDRLGVVVADEVHLLRDPDRGPTLEISLTRLRRRIRGLQIIALSATISNSAEVADWLDAVHISSSFRPVPLRTGVYRDGVVRFRDGSEQEIGASGEPLARLVRDTVSQGGQVLVFVSTRRSSEAVANALAPEVRTLLSPSELEELQTLTERWEGLEEEEETEGQRRLRTLLPQGTAFHNASLTNSERSFVERAFRARKVRCVVATPTLSAGINLPARRVVVRDLTRYDETFGASQPLPVLEVHQMCGRAGRPGLDPYGEAILLARGASEEEDLRERYLEAEPESVESRLASEAVLRNHLLALVASGEVEERSELFSFLGATYYGFASSGEEIRVHLRRAEQFLKDHELLEGGERLRATRFGKLTSDLYIDPVTSVILRQALRRAGGDAPPFCLLATVAATPDLPPFYLRRGEEELLLRRLADEERDLLVHPEEPPARLDLDVYLQTLKTASVLESWIEERLRLVDISTQWNVSAGDLRSRIERAEWLLSAMSQLARTECRPLVRRLEELAVRVHYGIRPDLLELVQLRGVGRVRGRALYNAGFTDLARLARAPLEDIAVCLGSHHLAQDILRQVGKRPRSGPVPPEASPDRPSSSWGANPPNNEPRSHPE